MIRDHFRREGQWMVLIVLSPLLIGVAAAMIVPGIISRRSAPGVTPDAAYAAADELFHSVVGCGYVEPEPRDAGTAWAFPVRVGYGASGFGHDPHPILVDKRTGHASWASAESFREELATEYPEF